MPRPQPKEKSDLALVLADPDYNSTGAQDKQVVQANPAAPPKRDEDATRQFQFKPLESLPGFAREVQVVVDQEPDALRTRNLRLFMDC